MLADPPSIAPGVLAAVTTRAPARLVKKIDDAPALAHAWRWSREGGRVVVETDGGERVTIATASVESVDALACSCLLAPKCLHLLAVARALPIGESAPAAEPISEPATPTSHVVPDADQRAAAVRALAAAAGVLEAGANGAGAVVQAELLAAVHACRAVGLPRIAGAGVRVVHGVRALRDRHDAASLDELTLELSDTVAAATHVARAAEVDRAWIGTARRAYAEVGSLRVHGLFCEPVLTKAGYAGVVTHVVDAAGALASVSDVAPGDVGRARGAYELGIDVGDATLSHRELSREGLFLANATRSADGRLGAGKNVRAVRSGKGSWDEPIVAALFAQPLDVQRSRLRAALSRPVVERPAGWDLVFARVTVLGLAHGALALALDEEGRVLAAVAPVSHAPLATRANLERLGRAPGLRLRVVGRAVLHRPGRLELLAIGAPDAPNEGARALRLPPVWQDRASLAYDAIDGAMITGPDAPTHVVLPDADEPVDPLASMRRRIQRAALGGRATLRPEETDVVAGEAARLEKRMLPSAAALLTEMMASATTRERDLRGARARPDVGRFADAWARAALHQHAASIDLALSRW